MYCSNSPPPSIIGLELIHMDEFIDELLHSERSCDIILPRIQKRYILEQNEELEPRVSALNDDLSEVESEEEGDGEEPDHSPSARRSPSPARHERERGRDRDRKSDRR